ncbi:hypothetical protein MHB42_15855 [Lysinibacillus sp. FSL K6-0232]|uniref:hypothetical protein n=1 Tax=unclassified Lysinibacillus TaxID=2636778 RepID=UPI0030FAC78C
MIFIIVSVLSILLIASFVILLARKLGKLTEGFWSPRKIFIGIISYLALGLCAFLYISLFLDSPTHVLSASELTAIEKDIHMIETYDQEYNGSFLTEQYQRDRWEFDFQGTSLPVTLQDSYTFNIRYRYDEHIPVGKAIVTYYQFPYIINGINIAGEIPTPHVYIEQNELIIQPLPIQHIQYKRAEAVLTFLAFNREPHDHSPSTQSSKFMVITISPDVELEDRQGFIQYLQ